MPFTIRPYRRFPVWYPVTYHLATSVSKLISGKSRHTARAPIKMVHPYRLVAMW